MRLDSMTVRSLVAGLASLMGLFGFQAFSEDEQVTMTEGILGVAAIGSMLAAWYHRVNPKASGL